MAENVAGKIIIIYMSMAHFLYKQTVLGKITLSKT